MFEIYNELKPEIRLKYMCKQYLDLLLLKPKRDTKTDIELTMGHMYKLLTDYFKKKCKKK